MSRAVCGICLCPYGDAGECACPKGTTNTRTSERADAKLDKLIDKVAEATIDADLPPQWCLDNQNKLVRFASALLADGKAVGEAVAWRTEATKFLRREAEKQRATNRQYPEHAKCYPEWEMRARWIEWLAGDLEAEQESAPPGLEPWQTETRPQQAAQVAYHCIGFVDGYGTEIRDKSDGMKAPRAVYVKEQP